MQGRTLEDGDNGKVQEEPMPTRPLSTVFQVPQEVLDGEHIRDMYKGIVEESMPSGVGTITYERNHHPAGIVEYEGFFDQGIRQGYGRASFCNGNCYQGNWANGVFDGNQIHEGKGASA
jgi:hypothetical protein